MKNYILPEEVLKALLIYLNERPYKEVAAGIEALSRLKVLEEKVDEGNVD
jgi:hypothetical protein